MQELLKLVLMDDGSLDIKCCNEKIVKGLNLKNPQKFDSFLKRITTAIIKKMWGEKNTSLSKIIRVLSMAEISACAEPYSQAEEFWSTMMFNYIPRTEKQYSSLKQQYGNYRGPEQRPISFGNAAMFELNPFCKNMN